MKEQKEWIDFRSDTITQPTPEMREAMMYAEIGDDVFGEDPSVNALETMIAAMFGMEKALFCPSGTMTNQIAIKVHTQPGDEVICDELSHVYQYEGGGIAFNAGASVRLLQGDRGRISVSHLEGAVNADDVHKAKSSLVVLENTSNRGGGSCYNINDIQLIKDFCSASNLSLHLDGARLFNALIARKETPEQYGSAFDSISICLSKGLGAPVGSLLLGSEEFIRKARRIRKVFGGGMRQAGYLAAAGIFALKHHVERLESDHQHAQFLAKIIQELPFVAEVLPVETNILIFETKGPAKEIVEKLRQQGILCMSLAPTQIRLVTHLDITAADIEKTSEVLCKI